MEDAELYQKSNSLQRRDAIQCLETYARKIRWKKFDRVIDIGCGDGGVTDILKTYMPSNCKLLGCDISEKMIDFANVNHGDDRTDFIVLDIEGKLPHDIREHFDHVFSFYTLHWIKNQESAFQNIYRLLAEGGDCLLMFLGHMPIYDVYRKLARNNKWKCWLRDVDRYVSPYHDSQHPDKEITKLLDKIGFRNIDVQCKQVEYKYDSVDILKKAVAAINPFDIPKDMFEDFMEDYIQVITEMRMVDLANNNIGEDWEIRFTYTLIIVKSEVSVTSAKSKNEINPVQIPDEVYVPPSDQLTVKILNLKIMDEDPKRFSIKVTFQDQLIVSGTVKAVGVKSVVKAKPLVRGTMLFDPSDYEKMCLFADYPLTVCIQPMKSIESNISGQTFSPHSSLTPSQSHKSSSKSDSMVRSIDDVYCCNIDILPLFIDKHKMSVEKRMEPLIMPSILLRKSWDNLPLLTMEVGVTRNKAHEHHHKVLKRANFMRVTLVASYNMLIPYDDESIYTAASKMTMANETNTGIVTFNGGCRIVNRFNSMCFYPKWESLRLGDDLFATGGRKFVGSIEELQNDDNIDLEHYMQGDMTYLSVVWASFHRTLFLESSDRWLWKHLRQYSWPFELHIYGEKGGYSFMAFLDLFRLLYPGEDTVRMAVPLQWINAEAMMQKCGCDLLLTPNDKAPSTSIATQKPSKATTESAPASLCDSAVIRATGADGSHAFVVLEVKLARPLKKIVIPTPLSSPQIKEMLKELEQQSPAKRECSGRGQLDRDWQSTVRSAANSIRKVPYYGMTEFCIFNRQLSETRTRVELTTSCWQDAAVYVNNNFVVQDFLRSDETFEEMVMMAHACLTKIACDTLVGVDNRQLIEPTLQAARHARQMQDIAHAMELYLQLVTQRPRDGSSWRELAVCLLDVDRDWANVCINKSVVLDPRHPLSLLTKGAMIFEENPALAEPFFVALLALFPFWTTAWVVTSAYYIERELFHVADQIIKFVKKTHADGLAEDIAIPRAWDRELGDWWDNTPLLPGMNRYFDAADLLLRLRAITLAEVCVSRALLEEGESAAYFHLVALCCRLRGNVEDALCHIQTGIQKYGEISYLRTLEAECYHKINNIVAATSSFEKAGSCIGAYSILLSTPIREAQRARTVLVDLVRRQPSAYAWMALAEDWMTRAATGEGGDAGATDEQTAAKTCAIACAVQALRWDRRAGRAWALLSKLVKPSARRLHCRNMLFACGYTFTSEERMEYQSASKQSLCHRLGTALRDCRCKLCENLKF